jgi:outer membrane protein TolC
MPLAAVVLASTVARADAPLTIQAALREARAHNARLPPVWIDEATSQAALREARDNLWPSVALSGDARYAPADANNGSELVVQAGLHGPIYDGGRLRAQIDVAGANVDVALARYRLAEAELEAEVYTTFSQELEAEDEVRIQQAAVVRLSSYVELVKLRKAGGQGLETDLLMAQAQLATQQAAELDAELAQSKARYALNDLLGRDPTAPLVLVPLPEPAPPPTPPHDAWLRAPDVNAAVASVRSAAAGIAVARAEHRPQLTFELAGGFFGFQPEQTPGESLGSRAVRSVGVAAMLNYSWTLFDFGAYHARLDQARLARDRASAERVVTERKARVSFDAAALELDRLRAQLAARMRATAAARDAFLAAESVYRGGGGTSLAVIDAHRTWVDAALAEAALRLRYRTAEAQYQRWGGP